MKDQSINEFEAFLRELRSLSHRFRTMGSLLHGDRNIPSSWRTLLATLEEGGPQTIPQLARIRFVSRQQIQMTVKALMTQGLVGTQPNPAHRTSHLIVLTPSGRKQLLALRKKEEMALRELNLPFEPGKIDRITAGLRQMRAALDKAHAELTSQNGRK